MPSEKEKAVGSAAAPKPGKRGRPVNPASVRQQKLVANVPERPRGRPVDPNSERQRLLALKPDEPRPRGRPIDPKSRRQALLASQSARQKSGKKRVYTSFSSGRPINPDSARQRALSRKEQAEESAKKGSQKAGKGRGKGKSVKSTV